MRQLTNGFRGFMAPRALIPATLPAPPRPGELRRAHAQAAHAAKGHRECAAWHRDQIKLAETATTPATPAAKAKGKTLEGEVEPPPILTNAELDTHAKMAEVHEKAAGELEAKAEGLAAQLLALGHKPTS